MSKKFSCLFLAALSLLFPFTVSGADQVSLTGSIQSVACAAACGVCCPTHSVVDSSGLLRLDIGNSFVDLSQISDDEEAHTISGYFYATSGQCGINQCTLFAIESVDQSQIPEPVFDASSQRISLRSIVINDDSDRHYRLTLDSPYNVNAVVEIVEANKILQGQDCSGENAICVDGTLCLAYYGIAGAQGPEFKSCELPCSHPGASCPLGQSCATIADGPGQVCVVD